MLQERLSKGAVVVDPVKTDSRLEDAARARDEQIAAKVGVRVNDFPLRKSAHCRPLTAYRRCTHSKID